MLLQIKHWHPPRAPEALQVLRQEDRIERVKEWGGLYVAMVFSNIMMTCRYGIHFPIAGKQFFTVARFYQKQTLLEGFLKVVWTLWEMRLQGRYGATVLSPISHVPMCVLSEMHQFLGETESVQMERHTCASTCTHTRHTHNNRPLSHNAHLTVRLCL